MDIVAELKRIAREIAGKSPEHAETLSQAANELDENMSDSEDTPTPSPTSPPAVESIDLDTAEKEVAADKVADEALLADPTPTPTPTLPTPPATATDAKA